MTQRAELRDLLHASDTQQESRHYPRWRHVALLAVSVLLVTGMGAASIAFYHVQVLNERVESTLSQVERKTRQIDPGIRHDSKRQRLLLRIRDEIMRANYRVRLGEAYEYAELLLLASEKYASLDPLLVLAVGIVESAYDPRATSPAGDVGLYQIRPTMGRMLARTLSWEYSDGMLYDPEKNTELAALYLDILLTTHDEVELALAEYMGGPRNAHDFRAGGSTLAEETRSYVPRVMAIYQRLRNGLEAEERRAELSGLSRSAAYETHDQ